MKCYPEFDLKNANGKGKDTENKIPYVANC